MGGSGPGSCGSGGSGGRNLNFSVFSHFLELRFNFFKWESREVRIHLLDHLHERIRSSGA